MTSTEPIHDDQAALAWREAHPIETNSSGGIVAAFNAGRDQAIREERARVEALIEAAKDAIPDCRVNERRTWCFTCACECPCPGETFHAALTAFEESR